MVAGVIHGVVALGVTLTGSLVGQQSHVRVITQFMCTGRVPTELGRLTALRWLCLAHNKLTGTFCAGKPQLVPTALDSVADQSGTQRPAACEVILCVFAEGHIHTEIGQMTALGSVEMNNNELSGKPSTDRRRDGVPNETASRVPPAGESGELTIIWPARCCALRAGSIPTEIGLLTRLGRFAVHRNRLAGNIPTAIGLTSLAYLQVNENQLSGAETHVHRPPALPVAACALTHTCRRPSCVLRAGRLPTEIGRLVELVQLTAQGNQLSGRRDDAGQQSTPWLSAFITSLLVRAAGCDSSPRGISSVCVCAGPIPTEIGQLSELQELRLHVNKLSGECDNGAQNS